MSIEKVLEERNLKLPAAIKAPPGVVLPFASVKIYKKIAFVSGHIAQNEDGSIKGPFGKVGDKITVEQAAESAHFVGLAILGSLKRELGDLDQIDTWISALGMVNAAPSFDQFPAVINGFSNLILDVFGKEKGIHTRSAVGVAGLPFNAPVEIEAKVALK